MIADIISALVPAILAGLAGAVIFALLGLISGTDETATLAPLTLAVVLLGVPPSGVLAFFIAGACAKHMTHAVPTTLLGIPGDTMAIALMEEAAHLRALGVPHVALRKMISAAFLAALLAVPIAVLCAALLAKVSDPLREAIPYVFPAVAVGIAYLSRGRWASVLALVPLTAMIVGLNSFVDQQIDKTLSISFFVGLAVGPMVVDLVGLISPLTRSKLPTRSRPVFTIAPRAHVGDRRPVTRTAESIPIADPQRGRSHRVVGGSHQPDVLRQPARDGCSRR
ncbi:tripartite tricarboxylate transporter permease [Gordonia humi]|uniref:tripartite tricarboxylate transporter permease n=1 Tax=Gordonia humi TaxID=686429 RepID=UPI0036226597